MADGFDRPRRVVVLGRTEPIDLEPAAREAALDRAELVVLALGHPLTPTQYSAIRQGLELASELSLWFDTAIVTSAEQAAELADPSEEVTIVASGWERRILERVVPPKARAAARPPVTVRADQSVLEPAGVLRRGATLAARENPSEAEEGGVGEIVDAESVEALTGREVLQPVLATVWSREEAERRKAARLIVYLGAAPGVGKTFAMLSEGQRRKSRGTDLVVGMVQTYGRPRTIEMLDGLETVPARKLSYRGTEFEEMDVEALVRRSPEVALIDELAHTNVPGSRRAKRWEDVLDVLAEGIVVITTVNVQHMASLNDVVAEVTGIRQQETVPDWVLDLADQVELVDMSPHALRRRMIHGNVYPDPRKAELALQRFFTEDNLAALRDLALMRVANQVDEDVLRRWTKTEIPETRERVLVCVSRPGVSDDLIRRGARIAQRTRGDLLVVHAEAGESAHDPDWFEHVRRLVEELGGVFRLVHVEDPATGILAFAYRQGITQIVVGESLRSRWQELLRGSFVDRLIRKGSDIDVHVIARRER